MQITLNFGRWTKLHSVAAIALTLVVGGIVGRAAAVNPTVTAPVRWAGGVIPIVGTISGTTVIYSAPPGSSFMLTDVIVGNDSGNIASVRFYVASGSCGTVLSSLIKINTMYVPSGETLVVPLVTGIGFSSGQTICASSSADMTMTLRGYAFTASPPG